MFAEVKTMPKISSIITFLAFVIWTTIFPNRTYSEPTPVFGSILAPYQFEEDERFVGFLPTLIEDINKNTSLDLYLEPIGLHQGRALITEEGVSGLLGIILEASRTRSGYENFIFSKGFGPFNLRFYGAAENSEFLIDPYSRIGTVAVVGVPGAFARQYLEDYFGNNITITIVESFLDGLTLAAQGRVEAFFGAEATSRYHYRNNLDELSDLLEGSIIYNSDITFASHARDRDLIESINAYRDQLSPEKLLSMQAQWLMEGPTGVEQWLFHQRLNYNRITYELLIVFILLGALLAAIYIRKKINIEKSTKIKFQKSVLALQHDIRNPLNTIANVFDEVSNQNKSLGARKIVYDSFDQIDELLEHLSYGEIQDTHGHANLKNVDIILELKLVRNKYQKYSSSIIDLQNPEYFKNAYLKCSRTKFQRLINNIIENSIRNSDYILVTINNDKSSNNVNITISNQCTEEPVEFVNYINSNEINIPNLASKQSSGLGGWIVKSICGDIGIGISASYSNSVLSIKLSLPISKDDIFFDAIVQSKDSHSTVSHAANWLIVDDSNFNAQLAYHHILAVGQNAVLVESRTAILELLESTKTKFDYYLIDLNLGNDNGIDLCEEIMLKFNISPEKFVIISGDEVSLAERKRFHRLGGAYVFTKPISLNMVLETIKQI